MTSPEAKAFVVRAVAKCDGEPMPDLALRSALFYAFPHLRLTEAELVDVIRSVEQSGWIAGHHDELLGLLWVITPKGTLRARQLR